MLTDRGSAWIGMLLYFSLTVWFFYIVHLTDASLSRMPGWIQAVAVALCFLIPLGLVQHLTDLPKRLHQELVKTGLDEHRVVRARRVRPVISNASDLLEIGLIFDIFILGMVLVLYALVAVGDTSADQSGFTDLLAVLVPILLTIGPLWLILKFWETSLGALTTWPVQSLVLEMVKDSGEDDHDLVVQVPHDHRRPSDLLSLEHRELLHQINQTNKDLLLQLIALGVKPEEEHPIPVWWLKHQEGPFVDEAVKANPDIRRENQRILANLKILLSLGYIRWAGDSFRLTLTGLEAVELPAILFVSNLPAAARIGLANAEKKLYSSEYHACAVICARTLEAFLKQILVAIHPQDKKRIRHVNEIVGTSLDDAALGTLSRVLESYLGEHERKSRDRLLSLGVDKKYIGTDMGRRLCRILEYCCHLRNLWTHDRSDQGGIFPTTSEIESALHLLHLSRIFVSVFCSTYGGEFAQVERSTLPGEDGT